MGSIRSVLRGSLEVVEFVPRQVIPDAIPEDHSLESGGIWSRLRLEHRTLTSCAAAVVSVAFHMFLVAPALWAGGVPPRHPLERKFAGDTAMQWVVLDDSPATAALTPTSLAAPALVAIDLPAILPTPPAGVPAADASQDKNAQSADHSSLGVMYGRYVGQIHARIERAWQRPRTAIGAPLFQCQVQVDQDDHGRVGDITLLQCNGDARWRLSLVHAIETASPLPAPGNPTVFARHVLLEFRGMAYSPDAQAELYEPPGAGPAASGADEVALHSQNALQALREAASASHSRKVIELRIEGSSVQVEPQHQ